MKSDERELLNELQGLESRGLGPCVRFTVTKLGMNKKRAAYILEKWADKGWYEYGVSVFGGWLTDEGRAA